MNFQQKINFLPLRTVLPAAVTGSYTPIGAILGNEVRVLALDNGLDEAVFISFDGINDHLFISDGRGSQFYSGLFSSNEEDAVFPVNTQVYIKDAGASPTTGLFVLIMGIAE